MDLLKSLYWLSKPGIVYGNTIALLVGFFFYSVTVSILPNPIWLVGAVVGTALVMASACVVNNIIDRDIDIHMERTRKRSLVTGEMSVALASAYAAITLIAGGTVLYIVNPGAMYLALAGWISYAIIYTYAKRVTYHATLIGTLPGAVPPLIGYIAAGGASIAIVLTLFLVMVSWQMVHFYAIAIFRQKEYANAHVPVVTQIKGVSTTIEYMQIWAYVSGLTLLATIIFTNLVYGLLIIALFVWWSRATLVTDVDNIKWSRKVFFSSLLFLVAWLAITIISVVAATV